MNAQIQRTKVQTHAYAIYLCGPSPEGKFYVGKTSNFSRRAKDHKYGVSRAAEQAPLLQDAISKYGWDCMQPGIISQTDIALEAQHLHSLNVAKFNSRFPDGYNASNDGPSLRGKAAAARKLFEEAIFSEEEIREAGSVRLTTYLCAVCGAENSPLRSDACDGCGLGIAFGREALTHLVQGGAQDSFILPHDKALRKSFRSSSGAELVLELEKSRFGLRRMDDYLPLAVAVYAARLFPYMHLSLKSDLLERRGMGKLLLGKFRVAVGSPGQIKTQVSVFRHLRKHKRELGISFASNVHVFARTMFFYGKTEEKRATLLSTLVERGATLEEITEAKEEETLLSEMREQHKADIRQLLLPKTNSLVLLSEEADEGVSFRLSLKQSPEEKRAFAENIFADDIPLDSWEGKPVVFLFHSSISPHKVVLFDSLAVRRAFVRQLLKLAPAPRLKHLETLSSDPDLGFEVREWVVPQPVVCNSERCSASSAL